jgi:dihydropteroate synthase
MVDHYPEAVQHDGIPVSKLPMTPPLRCGPYQLTFDHPQVMGILNVTPDSFSDGGRYAHVAAQVAAARAMIKQGAAIIDIGGESTRPGAQSISVEEEMARVMPVIEQLAKDSKDGCGAILSIDTRNAATMRAALAAGAHMINDVSALLHDPASLAVAAQADVPVILMHSTDAADTLHGGHLGPDPVQEVYDWLEARLAAVIAGGVRRENILIDPGIGFGKTTSENVALIRDFARFHGLHCPIVFGASRKRMIAALAGGCSYGSTPWWFACPRPRRRTSRRPYPPCA